MESVDSGRVSLTHNWLKTIVNVLRLSQFIDQFRKRSSQLESVRTFATALNVGFFRLRMRAFYRKMHATRIQSFFHKIIGDQSLMFRYTIVKFRSAALRAQSRMIGHLRISSARKVAIAKLWDRLVAKQRGPDLIQSRPAVTVIGAAASYIDEYSIARESKNRERGDRAVSGFLMLVRLAYKTSSSMVDYREACSQRICSEQAHLEQGIAIKEVMVAANRQQKYKNRRQSAGLIFAHMAKAHDSTHAMPIPIQPTMFILSGLNYARPGQSRQWQ